MSVSVHPCTVAIQAYSILQYTKKLGSTGVALIYVAQKWLFKLILRNCVTQKWLCKPIQETALL